MIDYTLFYKQALYPTEEWPKDLEWDVFVSSFDGSERVQTVYGKVRSNKKIWVLHQEYGISPDSIPGGAHFVPGNCTEAEFVSKLLPLLGTLKHDTRICIDITGFLKPHLMLIVRYLGTQPMKIAHLLYSEPSRYKMGEQTQFSDTVLAVRQVAGFEGKHIVDLSHDLLVIGTGYDSAAMAQVAADKGHARKIQIFGFPSLMPDMYQENVLRVHEVAEELGSGPGDEPNNYFAPANDPFVTAAVLQSVVEKTRPKGLTNLYLCPTGTKPQALGFALYYLSEWDGGPGSIIFPFSRSYGPATGAGIARTWMYTLEL